MTVANPNDDLGFPKRQEDFGAQNPFLSPLAEEERGGYGYVTPPGEPLNPWISMWTKPRETVRQQLDTDPAKHVLLLAMLGTIASAYDDATFASDDISYRLGEFVGFTIGGAIGGIIYIFLAGWLAAVIGRGLGGVGLAAQLRTALAWAMIPYVWIVPLTAGLALATAVLGAQAMHGDFARDVLQEGDLSKFPLWLAAMAVVGVVVFVWHIFVLCKAVGEAHQFSAWRGLGTMILSFITLVLGVLVLMAPYLLWSTDAL
jgi:hypothetical protein